MSRDTEAEVRAMLANRAAEARPASFTGEDLTSRGDAVRARRRVGAVCGAALAVAGIVLAGSAVEGRPDAAPPTGPEPSATAQAPRAPGHDGTVGLDVVDGHRLLTINEQITVPLDVSRGRVIAVRGGWVHQSADRDRILRIISPGGTVTKLAAGVDAFTVGSDGERITWVSDAGLTTAMLKEKKGDVVLANRRSTAVPRGVVPVTSSADRIVLSPPSTGNPMKWDTWDSGGGPFVPRWTTAVAKIYGAEDWSGTLGGGRWSLPTGSLVGLTRPAPGSRTGCLALLDPATLQARATRCDLGLSLESNLGSASPGAQFVFETAGSGGKLIDVIAAFSGSNTAGITQALPRPDQPPLWENNTAIAAVGGQLYRWLFGDTPEKLRPFYPYHKLVPAPFSANG
jgi:hypothetical protein